MHGSRPKDTAAAVLKKSSEIYVSLVPDNDPELFIQDRIARLFSGDGPTGDQLIVRFCDPSLTPPDRPFPTVIAGVFISIAFAVEAVKAEEANNLEEAWRLASQAMYWSGLVTGIKTAISGQGLQGFLTHVASGKGRKAATKRWGPKTEAMKFVQGEWLLHHEGYLDNKADFARTYVDLVLQKFGVKVTTKTMTETWLKAGTPDTSIPA